MFKFAGAIESSKSIANRALIIQSYEPEIKVEFLSDSMDVQVLQKSLQDFREGHREFFCADAGTAFRFLVLRLAREPGRWTVRGSPRLLSRPQDGLLALLGQWAVGVETFPDHWILKSNGWNGSPLLDVSTEHSSQFASAVFLNAWKLSRDTELKLSLLGASQSYLEMTLQIVKDFGLNFETTTTGFWIPARQSPRIRDFVVEPDVSSCFALASCAVQNGDVQILKFPFLSKQPDLVFLDIYKKMNVSFERDGETLKVQKTEHLYPIDWALKNCPDLFPVLAILCARAQGVSCLTGLDHLAAKESNRLQNIRTLLHRLGRKTKLENLQLWIEGDETAFTAAGDFDPDHDHRMAMAAQVANFYGADFRILKPEVVDKSYPRFWHDCGVV